ncbi:hypothetical protein BDZ45DRAFT_751584 [Acephala macrosclerotiorum]|nr:hypothetical protein BDZ45DRAFT_751584 [Acephala macrosclerotiorum]
MSLTTPHSSSCHVRGGPLIQGTAALHMQTYRINENVNQYGRRAFQSSNQIKSRSRKIVLPTTGSLNIVERSIKSKLVQTATNESRRIGSQSAIVHRGGISLMIKPRLMRLVRDYIGGKGLGEKLEKYYRDPAFLLGEFYPIWQVIGVIG